MLCTRCKKRQAITGLHKCARCRKARTKSRRDRNKNRPQQRNEIISQEAVKTLERRLRAAAIEAYGGPECTCCGCDVLEFLTIDYLDRIRYNDRQPITIFIYYWLQERNYPDGFQVLCCNCSTGKSLNGGVCPHKLIPNLPIDKKPVITKPPGNQHDPAHPHKNHHFRPIRKLP